MRSMLKYVINTFLSISVMGSAIVIIGVCKDSFAWINTGEFPDKMCYEARLGMFIMLCPFFCILLTKSMESIYKLLKE